MNKPVFVVGTGRCGSTMLSNMLREHSHVLSLSEFFAFVIAINHLRETLYSGSIDGRKFWEIISAITPEFKFFLKHGAVFSEWLYPYDDPFARFSRATGVPGILLTTLPHLTKDHERLFDLLRQEVSGWPTATMPEHYSRLFGWLAQRFGKRLWVERSGASLAHVGHLSSAFPDARFVHVVRDGRDAALSVQEHLGLRMGMIGMAIAEILGGKPFAPVDPSRIHELPPELRPFVPENFDDDAFRAYRVPLPSCGAFWAQQIIRGLKLLDQIPAESRLTLRYEDFFVDPKGRLDTLAAFLGEDVIDEDWSARSAATVRPPRSTWRDLPEDEARALTEACLPGFEALREMGVAY